MKTESNSKHLLGNIKDSPEIQLLGQNFKNMDPASGSAVNLLFIWSKYWKFVTAECYDARNICWSRDKDVSLFLQQ